MLPGMYHGITCHIPELREQENLFRIAVQFIEAVDRFGILYGGSKYGT